METREEIIQKIAGFISPVIFYKDGPEFADPAFKELWLRHRDFAFKRAENIVKYLEDSGHFCG